ncbi:hypothetical protein FQZ97_1097870 [compost metagenome]
MQADFPDLGAASQVHRPRDRGDPPAAQVVGVHLQADAGVPRAVDAQVAAGGTQGFRQHHRGAAMQQAVRLVGARVDRHAGGDRLLVEGFETNPQDRADGVRQHRVERVQVRTGAPYAHG